MHRYDVVVIGAGLIGLATALRLIEAQPRCRILVVDKELRVAAHQSGHNSGVIHSGIYYRPGSHKARNCVEGVERLEAFCQDNEIPVNRCGKVIVATAEDELPRLDELYRRGIANGVKNLELIESERLREIEPHAAGIRALHCPNTSIVDYVQVAEAYAARLCDCGVEIALGEEVVRIQQHEQSTVVETGGRECEASLVINCGGVRSDQVAHLAGDPSAAGKILPFRGEYYRLRDDARHLVKGLIYPVPDPKFPFLGVHLTLMSDGGVEAGPNAVFAYSRDGYRKRDISLKDLTEAVCYRGFWAMAARYWRTGLGEMYRSYSKNAFLKALQRLLPVLTADDLVPGGSGVRAQVIKPDGTMLDDFWIEQSSRCLHVLNAPSPGATASLAIGEQISKQALTMLSLKG
ncbi:L-2-hydroxyglutarate dehydrogenase, mitochondrial [Chlamydiales bacterium SCGC AG-110-P3]|nr:L-2-hydroxyglutarate dehydrogenase, mitochondrial [Chlamydiales bacterium SCGC AG-110-P3]